MIRGTTPTVTIAAQISPHRFSYRSDLPPGRYTAEVSARDVAGNAVTKTWTFDVVGGAVSTVTVHLSQADTLSFPEDRTVKVQLRAVKDGDAIATEVGTLTASEVLLEEEIPLEG